MPTPNSRHDDAGTTDWRALASRLESLAMALTRNQADADDLVQQTLLKLLGKAPERADHLGYARATMTRAWLDEQRSVRRRVRRMFDAARLHPTIHQDRAALDESELIERVGRAIDTLPPRQRAVFALRLMEGLDYEAIAQVLDCSIETVRASLHLARQRVRRHLGEEQ
ncbi:MAG: sigma-70 family RNA polymerase sigma factor [Phycisphaerae bacterium]|nr:sigma-70 family RNA polymerase sigma factor [Phycisphaerae bacterium]